MLSFLTASVLRDLSFRTRLGRRPHTINADSLASLHSTQLARLTLTFFFPRSTKCNRDAVSSLIVGGARILVEFAFAPPPATAGRQYRNAWRNMRRATARSTSSASQRPRAKSRVLRARAILVAEVASVLVIVAANDVVRKQLLHVRGQVRIFKERITRRATSDSY